MASGSGDDPGGWSNGAMLGRLRWANIPLPEPHLIGFGVGLVAQVVAPWRLPVPSGVGLVVGLVLILGGLALAGWAVWAAASVHMAHPGRLVDDGPYAHSRNPMYVGWTITYVGITLVLRSAWLLALLPLVLLSMHVVVLREERRLARTFGPQFNAYRSKVRRYL
ncbi:MAG TPA: isoprenylcysteine carboxylmethyltransferase family protein [Jiangellales bacterium]|nr:isoprenylcysteine carboxylmethyltransferase family protein [Jiangellales bacterium]